MKVGHPGVVVRMPNRDQPLAVPVMPVRVGMVVAVRPVEAAVVMVVGDVLPVRVLMPVLVVGILHDGRGLLRTDRRPVAAGCDHRQHGDAETNEVSRSPQVWRSR